jgi:hypothetical protein
MLSHGHKNHRVLRAVASVGSIGSRTSSSEGTGGDSPPIGTPRDSFDAQQERAIMQATHSRTLSDGADGSIKSVHIAKSVPLLNRSVHRRVVMNKSPAMPLDAAMMEVNQPGYTRQHYPHYIKRSHLWSSDEGEVERSFGRPFSWDSDFRDQRTQSPSFDEYDRDYQGYRRKARDSDTSEDWQVDYSTGNVQRLGSVTPQIVPAPRLQASASMAYLPSPPTEQSTPHEEVSRRGEDGEGRQGLQPKRQTPLRPTRSQGSLRMRAKRAAPTPEAPPVPALPTAFKFPQIVAEESQITGTESTIPVPRVRPYSALALITPSSIPPFTSAPLPSPSSPPSTRPFSAIYDSSLCTESPVPSPPPSPMQRAKGILHSTSFSSLRPRPLSSLSIQVKVDIDVLVSLSPVESPGESQKLEHRRSVDSEMINKQDKNKDGRRGRKRSHTPPRRRKSKRHTAPAPAASQGTSQVSLLPLSKPLVRTEAWDERELEKVRILSENDTSVAGSTTRRGRIRRLIKPSLSLMNLRNNRNHSPVRSAKLNSRPTYQLFPILNANDVLYAYALGVSRF